MLPKTSASPGSGLAPAPVDTTNAMAARVEIAARGPIKFFIMVGVLFRSRYKPLTAKPKLSKAVMYCN